jgi:hypothetical protein
VGAGRSFWLTPLFLLFGVLAPAGCVVWFMNAATNSQADAARQSVKEAYRTNMRLLRDRADTFWRDRAVLLDAALKGSEPLAFQRIVTQGLADSAVMPHYPVLAEEGLNNPVSGRADWQSASTWSISRESWRTRPPLTRRSRTRSRVRRQQQGQHRRGYAHWRELETRTQRSRPSRNTLERDGWRAEKIRLGV